MFGEAWRSVRRSPGFAAAIVAVLALAIGANTAIFAVVEAVLLQPLPYANSNRLVMLWRVHARGGGGAGMSFPDFRAYRRQAQFFSAMSVVAGTPYTLTGAGPAAGVVGVSASANLFHLLGVSPVLGPGFAPGDDLPGAVAGTDAVVLSHHLWISRFGGRHDIVGQRITLDSRPYTVVGVMPRGFAAPPGWRADLWTTTAGFRRPLGGGPPLADRRAPPMFLLILARLKPGVTMAAARSQMRAIGARIARRHPRSDGHTSVAITTVQAYVSGRYPSQSGAPTGAVLEIILAAAACLLLVAAANLAGLMLSRGAARRGEIAVRAALGASRVRLAGELMAESVILAALGGAAGLALAAWLLPILTRLSPLQFPRLAEAHLGVPVLAFAAAAVLGTAVVVGWAPALHAARGAMEAPLREAAGRSRTEGRRLLRVRAALVVAQVAATVTLLSAAALLALGLARMEAFRPGFAARNALVFDVTLPSRSFPPRRAAAFFTRLDRRLRRLPGVTAAGAVTLDGYAGSTAVLRVAGRRLYRPGSTALAATTPGYFAALGVVLGGRDFTRADSPAAPPVAIVNRAFARQFFSRRKSPLGLTITPGVGGGVPRTIVGVAGDLRFNFARSDLAPAAPEIYLPEAQVQPNPIGLDEMTYYLRTPYPPMALARAARRVLGAMDPSVPLAGATSLRRQLRAASARAKFEAVGAGSFAALALLLTAVGLYGVIASGVVRRRREIGIRLALGARRGQLLRRTLGESLRLSASGAGLGFVGGWLAQRWLAGAVFGLPPARWLVPLASVTAILAVALVAAWIPADRAAAADPGETLRAE